MATQALGADEVVRRGQELYEQKIRAQVDVPENEGKYLSINVETGEWEMDASDIAALERGAERFGAERCFFMRIGHSAVARFGWRGTYAMKQPRLKP